MTRLTGILKRGYYKERQHLKVCRDCGLNFRKVGVTRCYECRRKQSSLRSKLIRAVMTPEQRTKELARVRAWALAHPDRRRQVALASYHRIQKKKGWSGRF